ncbi:MAG TPA: TRAM domain-containing protein [archaeon]|nr:TRAM domain-containing protein [archaeon]
MFRERRGGGGGGRGFGRGGGGGGRGFGDRDRGFRDDFDKPKPVKIGEEYTVKIDDVGQKGDGIAKIENFIIFVPNGEKGKEVRVKIKEVARKFAIAEIVGEGSESKEESDKSSDESSDESSDDESSDEAEGSEEESSEE